MMLTQSTKTMAVRNLAILMWCNSKCQRSIDEIETLDMRTLLYGVTAMYGYCFKGVGVATERL